VYASGHTITSALFGFAASRSLSLPLVPTVVVSLAMNHLDVDHLFEHGVDDGTVNSLVTHSLHIYGSVPIFAACALAAAGILRPHWAVVVAGAYSLHLAADAFAYAIGYSIPGQFVATLAAYSALVLLLRRAYPPEVARRGTFFFVAAWLACDLEAGTVHFVLGIRPEESAIPWVLPHVVGLCIWTSFARLFRTSAVSAPTSP
jgi:hypothetical protein